MDYETKRRTGGGGTWTWSRNGRSGGGGGATLEVEVELLKRRVEEICFTTESDLRDAARVLVQHMYDNCTKRESTSSVKDDALDDVYVTLMNAANIRKEHELALRVFRSMLSNRMEPTVRAYSAAVRAATSVELNVSDSHELDTSRTGRMRRCHGDRRHPLAASLCSALVARMRNSGMAAGINVYCLAAEACAKTARWESALLLLGDVRNGYRMPLNRALYSSAIRACGNAGEWERALLLLLSMRQNCVTPDAVVASDIVGILWDAGLRQRAISLMRLWQRRWTLQAPDMAAAADEFVLIDLHGLSPGAACVHVAQLFFALRTRLDSGREAPSTVVIITGKLGTVRGSSQLRMQVVDFLATIRCDGVLEIAPDNKGRLQCTGSRLASWLLQFDSIEEMERVVVENTTTEDKLFTAGLL